MLVGPLLVNFFLRLLAHHQQQSCHPGLMRTFLKTLKYEEAFKIYNNNLFTITTI